MPFILTRRLSFLGDLRYSSEPARHVAPTSESPGRSRCDRAGALASSLAVLVARRPGARLDRRERPNVILITIDTLRADHLGCYGDASALTPALDDLARRGVRFATAVAHAPLTAPSHASILTSRTPLDARRARQRRLRPAGRECGASPRTSAAPATRRRPSSPAFRCSRRFGLDRGFETYDDHLPRGSDKRRTAYVERSADRTTDAVVQVARRDDGVRGRFAGAPLPVGPLLRRARALRAAGRLRRPRELSLRGRDRLRGLADRAACWRRSTSASGSRARSCS